MAVFSVTDISELPEVADKILQIIESPIVLLYGEMGTGKTTLVKQLAKALGADASEIVSPTFSLVNVYQSSLAGEIYHFDLYRLKSFEELIDIGFEDYISSGKFCFIEWPQLTEHFFETRYSTIHISLSADNTRLLRVENY